MRSRRTKQELYLQEHDAFKDIAQLNASFHNQALGSRFLLRVPFGVPDWGFRQKKLISAYVLGKSSFEPELSSQALEKEICTTFGFRFCIATGSGREAIKLALLSLGGAAGDRVVLPSFCCFSVLQPLLDLGIEPVLADAGSDLQIDPESVKRVMRPGDLALIVPHLFGGMANMPKLLEIARANGAAVIDDAAQAIGLQNTWGWAGSAGEAGIFSFGLFKPLNAMGGGAFVTNDETLYSKAKKLISNASYAQIDAKTIFKTYLKVVWRKATYRLFLYNRMRQQNNNSAQQSSANSTMTRISSLSARLAISQLRELPARRKQAVHAAQAFREKISQIPVFQSTKHLYSDGCPRFIVKIDSKTSQQYYCNIFKELLRRGVEVQPTYRPLHRFLQEMGVNTNGEFAHSEELPEKLICLPCPDTSIHDQLIGELCELTKQE